MLKAVTESQRKHQDNRKRNTGPTKPQKTKFHY